MANLTKEGYLHHLLDIKEKLHDFLQLVNNGKYTYIRDVCLKLRILYISKSREASLLESIQKEFDFKFSVFKSYSISEHIIRGTLPRDFPKPDTEIFTGVSRWFTQTDEMIPLLEAFEKNGTILINGYFFSLKNIIEVIADKMGGAHIDKKIKDIDLIPHAENFLIGNLTIANNIAYIVANQTILLIEHIEKFIETETESIFIKKTTKNN